MISGVVQYNTDVEYRSRPVVPHFAQNAIDHFENSGQYFVNLLPACFLDKYW